MSNDKLYNSGRMPRTETVINELADAISEEWRVRILNFKPSWWGRSAVDDENYEIIISKVAGGVEVYWKDKGNSQYDFQKIVNEGRDSFSIKDSILAGPRSRLGKNGRYAIVPFTRNKDGKKVNARNNDIAGTITKTGSFKDSQGMVRNNYSYNRKGGKGGNTYRFVQNIKNNKKQYSYIKFVMISEKSKDWVYPAFQGGHFDEKMQELAEDQLNKLLRKGKPLADAIEQDLAQYFSTVFNR